MLSRNELRTLHKLQRNYNTRLMQNIIISSSQNNYLRVEKAEGIQMKNSITKDQIYMSLVLDIHSQNVGDMYARFTQDEADVAKLLQRVDGKVYKFPQMTEVTKATINIK